MSRPEKEQYKRYDAAVDEGTFEENDGVTTYYHKHLFLWELEHFRTLFINEMERLKPGWRQHHEASVDMRSFESAVSALDRMASPWKVRDFLHEHKRKKNFNSN